MTIADMKATMKGIDKSFSRRLALKKCFTFATIILSGLCAVFGSAVISVWLMERFDSTSVIFWALIPFAGSIGIFHLMRMTVVELVDSRMGSFVNNAVFIPGMKIVESIHRRYVPLDMPAWYAVSKLMAHANYYVDTGNLDSFLETVKEMIKLLAEYPPHPHTAFWKQYLTSGSQER